MGRHRLRARRYRGVSITDSDGFLVKPGIYELGTDAEASALLPYYVPAPYSGLPYIINPQAGDAVAAKPLNIRVQLGGIGDAAMVSAELRHSLNKWKTVQLQRRGDAWWEGAVPADMLEAGLLEYRVLVHEGTEWQVFPAGIKGDPYAWDYVNDERYRIRLLPEGAPVVLFDAARDRDRVTPWIGDWRNSSIGYTFRHGGDATVLRATMSNARAGAQLGWQVFSGDRVMAMRDADAPSGTFSLGAWSDSERVLRVALVDRNGQSFVARFQLMPGTPEHRVPLSAFTAGETLLLPRPYPGFQPLWFKPAGMPKLHVANIDKIQFSFEGAAGNAAPQTVEVQYARIYQ
ncbi:MAG: hypothetical protein EOO16_10520 [Chitinophagaceae bacterium]|nr:MAG: hypothetical protein EOO16_10520 [Chitinophagaceae bacterium]